MKAEVKVAWVADLRANPEAQGQGALDRISEDGKRKQCCLGRLCVTTAIGANDSEYWTFPRIADAVEQNVPAE